MIFSDSPQQRALERMMTAVPRFRPKGGGITEPLLQYASETELSVEDIVETALKNYLERSQDNA